jgi:hypothetical protein
MPESTALVRALALSAALVAGGLPARADDAVFDFSIAGFRVGAMTLKSDQSGSSYAAASRIDTAGVVGIFTDFFFDGNAAGRMREDGSLVPSRYAAVSKSPRALRRTEIDWKGGVPVRVSVEPPRATAPDPAKQGGTLDPVSAAFALLRDAPADEVCATTVDVFDGSRLSRLKLGRAVAAEGQLVCDGTYARIEGEASSMASAREFPFRIIFRRNGAGLAELQRIEAPTDFGRAVVSRRG